MAWRLNQMVTRGVIDNRQKGKVLGTLWLIGQESAIRLELDGNCDEVRVSEPAWSFTADEKAERQKLAEQGAGLVQMVRADDLYGDTEKPDQFLYEQAVQNFDNYVLKFEEL